MRHVLFFVMFVAGCGQTPAQPDKPEPKQSDLERMQGKWVRKQPWSNLKGYIVETLEVKGNQFTTTTELMKAEREVWFKFEINDKTKRIDVFDQAGTPASLGIYKFEDDGLYMAFGIYRPTEYLYQYPFDKKPLAPYKRVKAFPKLD